MSSYPPPPPPPADEGGDQPSGAYPAPYPQSQSTGGMPVYPSGAGEAAPAVQTPSEPPPQSIVRAVLLMRVGAGLSLVSIVVGLLTLGSVKDNIRKSLQDSHKYTQSNFDTAYHFAVIFALVLGVIAVGLWLWMAQVNGAGRKWARTVSSVLGGLSILGFVASIAQNEQTAISVVLSGIQALLAVVILGLLWRRESTAFYNARSTKQLS